MLDPERPIDPPYEPYELNPEFSVEFDEENHEEFVTPFTVYFIGTVNELDGDLENVEVVDTKGDMPNWSEEKWNRFFKQPKIWEKLENSA